MMLMLGSAEQKRKPAIELTEDLSLANRVTELQTELMEESN
jgi:hypothetical protein